MAEKIEQPSFDFQEAFSDLLSREPDVVDFCGRRYRIGWLRNGVVRKFSHIMLKEKDPWKRNVKVCACVLLNGRNGLLTRLLLLFWHWIYWRWLYYVKDIDQMDVLVVLNASKKKIQSEPLAMATILATAMMDTMMMMARHEVGRAERVGEQPSP